MFRLLVVDNNVTRANLTAKAVKDLKFGIQINFALSAVQAALYLAGTKTSGKLLPNMILMGTPLPDTTGLDGLKTFRKAAGEECSAVVVVADDPDGTTPVEYYNGGAAAYVKRPTCPDAYRSAVADAVSFVAMIVGLIPRQAKFLPEKQRIPLTANEILQVHL